MKTLTNRIGVACSTALVLAAGSAASAQCTQGKLLAADRQNSDFFGGALAGYLDAGGSAPRVMIGVGADDTAAGANAGSVYTFGRINNAWGAFAQFTANDGQPNDFFGTSVGCSDPYAVVGATGVGDNGAVYFFERFGPDWVQKTKFEVPAGGQIGSDMGRSVAMHGTWAVVGVPLRDFDTGPNNGFDDVNAGEVRFFRRNADGTWSNTQTEDFVFSGVMSGQGTGDQFGSAVSMKNGWVVVGAPRADAINWPTDHGICFVYRLNGSTWEYVNDILSFSAGENDRFGSAVSTDGVSFAIGCPLEDATSNDLAGQIAKTDCGSVYIYRLINDTITIEARVFAQDASDGANFGSSVHIDGDTMVVGADGAHTAYIFKRDSQGDWHQLSALRDPDTAGGDYASAVTMAGTQVLVGDQGDEELFSGMTNHGAVYTYTLPGATAASDECGGAAEIAGHGIYGGCTYSATAMGTTTCGMGGSGQGPDVWYAWTPVCSGSATINTNGSDFDTVLSVHSACPGNGGSQTIICDDDSGDGFQSALTLNYEAGTRYLIRIAGYDGASGTFTMNIVESAAPTNDDCGAAATVVTTGVYEFSTCRATDSVRTQTNCGPQGTFNNDVWFKFFATTAGTATVDLCGSTFDTKVAVYGAPICPIADNTAIACNDDQGGSCPSISGLTSRVSFPTTAGNDYYIRVGGYGSNMGDVTMTITNFNACPCDWNGVNGLTVQDVYDFLSSWSAGTADFNQIGGTTVQDIYDFLTCWSAGCN